MNMQTTLPFAIALGIGLLIGVERERRNRRRLLSKTAGVRTFAIVSLLGAVAMHLGGGLLLGFAVAGLGGVLLAHARGAGGSQELATQAALLLTLALGGLCLRDAALASGLAVTVTVLLAAQSCLHRFVRRVLSAEELVDALILAAAALVVMPLLPDAYIGPFDPVNLRTIWKFTLLVMAVSAAGHIALRVFGPRIGLPLAGIASGFISSTLTIGVMGQRATADPALRAPAVAGAVLSSVSTTLLMATVLGAISPAVLRTLMIPLVCSGAAALGYGLLFLFRVMRQTDCTSIVTGRPFRLRTAGILALMAAGVLLGTAALNSWMGSRGIAIGALLGGLIDTHAAAASVATLVAAGMISPEQCVVPVLAAMSANALSKAIFAAVSGGFVFAAQVVPGLLLMVTAAWVGYALA